MEGIREVALGEQKGTINWGGEGLREMVRFNILIDLWKIFSHHLRGSGRFVPYSTLSLRPCVEYGNSSPRVWESITILLPPSEGGMYHTFGYRGSSG